MSCKENTSESVGGFFVGFFLHIKAFHHLTPTVLGAQSFQGKEMGE